MKKKTEFDYGFCRWRLISFRALRDLDLMLTDVAATHETVLRLISLKAKQEAVANEEEAEEEEGVKHYIYSTDFCKSTEN